MIAWLVDRASRLYLWRVCIDESFFEAYLSAGVQLPQDHSKAPDVGGTRDLSLPQIHESIPDDEPFGRRPPQRKALRGSDVVVGLLETSRQAEVGNLEVIHIAR